MSRAESIGNDALSRWKGHRAGWADDINDKLRKVPELQRRLKIYTDPSVAALARERLTKAFQVAEENGFDFTPVTKEGEWHFAHTCTLRQGDVATPMQVEVNIDLHGVVSLNFTLFRSMTDRYTSRTRAYRISVGKAVRITNNLLEALVNK